MWLSHKPPVAAITHPTNWSLIVIRCGVPRVPGAVLRLTDVNRATVKCGTTAELVKALEQAVDQWATALSRVVPGPCRGGRRSPWPVMRDRGEGMPAIAVLLQTKGVFYRSFSCSVFSLSPSLISCEYETSPVFFK